ncbi:MAG: lipase family protein [Paludibacteraceae bacterium]|nr:lipase family protein [Paludibacteraceae bacterium]
MKYQLYFLLLLLPLWVGCQTGKELSVDFTDIEGAANLRFQVISQHETDLSKGLPEQCFLPDGTPANAYRENEHTNTPEGMHRTTSITGSSMLQQLLRYGKKYTITEIVGTYPSTDGDGNEVILSGKVMLPKGQKPKRMILVSHYTVCSNIEAPSNCFSLEGVLVKLGYGLIIPDYLGYGVTADQIHPYLVMDLTARNVFDMYLAVREWLKAAEMEPEHDEICLMGYSQGGATTMAVQYLIENKYCFPEHPEYTEIHRVFAGGGPYDVKATYERFVNTDTAGYPVAVPLVLQGMIKGNKLDIEMTDLMQEWLYNKMDDWVNSKLYSSSQINALIDTKVTHEILTQEAMDQTSDNVAELYKAMTANSIISYNWVPKAPVYIMHSIDDETVPYTNATNAKSRWKDANITYNFGHYGGHVMTCLRFIYSVQTLLQQEEEEMKQYE